MHIPDYVRTGLLGLGVVSSWTALASQFIAFLQTYGTLWHVSTSVATNPVLTPCLYGSLAFLAAFIWSCALLLRPNLSGDIWLNRLLLFGAVFAAAVVLYDCSQYYKLFSLGVPLVCSPQANPFFTACFRGLVLFVASYLAGVWVIRKRSIT
jgi:hypothetical protein